MKRLVFVSLTVLAFVFACPAQTLTLARCLELAKSYSLKARASDAAIRGSELEREELLTTKLPQVKLSSEASYAPNSGTHGYDPAITDGGQLGGRIAVQQSLYDAGVRSLRSEQLSTERNTLVKEKQITERDLVFAVEQLFIEALRSQNEIVLQQQSMRQLKDYLDLIQQLTKGGQASYTDLLKTQVQLQTAERSLQKAHESLASTKYALAEAMGRSIDTSFAIEGSMESLLPVPPPDGNASDLSQNLDITLAQLNVSKSAFDIEIQKSERMPVVSAFADAGLLTSIDNLRLPSSERSGMFGYMVGLSLEVPLFTWGATDLRAQQRQLATDALGLQLEAVRRSVTTDYQRTQMQLKRVEERVRSLRISLKAADENFVLTKSKYASGGVLSLEVLAAQQLLMDLKLDELQTLADRQALLAKMEQITTR
ncbi:MAG: TolC family protein [Ignavibacteriales bacterium]|nr:TolC family protein [Ignavibacteriales bacterium]